MTTRILCAELPQHRGEQVTIKGWVHSHRQLGGHLAFLNLRDRSGIVQVVLEGELAALPLSTESVISVTGRVVEAKIAALGVEVSASHLERLAPAQSPLPIEVNKKDIPAGLETILDHRVLALRNPKVHATFTIQSVLAGAFREFFTERGFTQIFTPKIVAAGTEGRSNLFPI
ncbi:MAG: OB-fold nucleic acid binding domain-containing protein, partial [Tumebacillaceae bacterium]